MNYLTLTFCVFYCLPMTGSHAQNRVPLDSITKVLENILSRDQKYRSMWDSVQRTSGYNSPEFIAIIRKTTTQDSINMIEIESIMARYGWLSAAQTSKEANDAFFLVIQHAPLEKQLIFLPLMKKAVADKKANSKDLALLIDRTNMYQGKLQLYGSQFYFDAGGNIHLYPIEDEPHVDERRKSMGLLTMAEYVKLAPVKVEYATASRDAYKKRIVMKGSVINAKDNTPLEGVSIYLANNTLLGKSEKGGFFQIILEEKYRHWAVIFRKQGFGSLSLTLDSNEKIVYDLNPAMTED